MSIGTSSRRCDDRRGKVCLMPQKRRAVKVAPLSFPTRILTVENPLVGTARRHSLDMLRYASEFGFTPTSRTCVVKGSLVKANKFGDLLDGA